MAQEIVNECWRSIDGYINYQVSNLGRVRNSNTGHIMTGTTNTKGYQMVMLSKGRNTCKNCTVHRLVAREFLDNPENKPQVDHIDHDKTNNHLSNLRWATRSENQCNQRKHRDGCSRFKGVSKKKSAKKWTAQIMHNGRVKYIGLFKTGKEAARAYNAKALELQGEFASLNETSDDKMMVIIWITLTKPRSKFLVRRFIRFNAIHIIVIICIFMGLNNNVIKIRGASMFCLTRIASAFPHIINFVIAEKLMNMFWGASL